MRNSQLSSRLIVASASPKTIADRSRTNRNSECGPYRRAIVRCCGSALWVTFSDSQISADSTSRAPRAFSRAADSAPTIELGLVRSKARVREHPLGVRLGLRRGRAHQREQVGAGAALVDPRVLDQALGVHVEDAGGVVGPFDVAADPEQRLRDPAQHGVPRAALWP